MNKLLGIVASLAMMLALVGGVKACGYGGCFPKFQMPSNDIKVENIGTDVVTVAKVEVNTGDNMQMGGTFSKLMTGSVIGAYANAQSQVNMTMLPDCNCRLSGDMSVKNMFTDVATIAKVEVETGDNHQMSFGHFTMPKISTGSVGNLGTTSSAMVNYVGFSAN